MLHFLVVYKKLNKKILSEFYSVFYPIVQLSQVSSIFICKWGQMRPLCPLKPRRECCRRSHPLIRNNYFCYVVFSLLLTRRLTKYIYTYLQEQVWKNTAIKATNAKSLETSKFQHKFYRGDAETQPFRFLSTSQSHSLPTTAISAQDIKLEKVVHKQVSNCDFNIHPGHFQRHLAAY